MSVHKCARVGVGVFWGRKQLWSNLSGISCYIYCGKWNLLIRSAFFSHDHGLERLCTRNDLQFSVSLIIGNPFPY